MTCDELREYMNATLRDERQPQRMEQLRRHTQECLACAEYLSEFLQLEQKLSCLPTIPTDADITSNIMERISQKSAQTKTRRTNAIWEGAWLVTMWLGLGTCALAACRTSNIISWLQDFSRPEGRLPPITGPLVDFLHQPLPILAISTLGMIFLAAAFFWPAAAPNTPEDTKRGFSATQSP